MPKIEAVWGIDIGNCSLKALRCRAAEEPGHVIADAFDYIEYPQILTQPGAEPSQLVSEALQQFLSRNNLRGTSVAISVSGQNGLARFIKLPPVESRKIPDIVHYEARQQIPFDLDDVIWDYQRMGGGLEEEGFVLEAEIGLFAMKRDQVFRALEPFDHAGIGVDCVQLAPLALYNYLVFDQLTDLPPPDEYDSENPPPSTVILSMGTDASDLVVTNGFRVWQRSIPIGGNHFTKALVKELKLTFAKAELLKRNAAAAQDPKAVFQAMRQVFNDLLTEIQRSVGYYTTLDRAAKIQRLLAVGNAMKLPGLRRFLAQGLGCEVEVLERFRGLTGAEVLGAPAFQENHLCFPVCYGLALQALKRSSIRTNLIPKEIVKDRVIRAKKPWAVAAAAVLLLGCTISFVSYSRALATVDADRFKDAETKAEAVVKEAKNFQQADDAAKAEMKSTDQIGANLVQNVEGRIRWLELLRAVNSSLPRDAESQKVPDDLALWFETRNQLHVLSLDCQPLESVDPWLAEMKQNNWLSAEDAATVGDVADASSASSSATSPGVGIGSPSAAAMGLPAAGEGGSASSGEGQPVGFLVTLRGYHYHNNRDASKDNIGAQYVRNTLMKELRNGEVSLPAATGGEKERVTMKDLGISYPVLINPGPIREETLQDPYAMLELEAARAAARPGTAAMPGMPGMMPGMPGMMPGMDERMPPMPGMTRRSGASSPKRSIASMPGMMPGIAMPGIAMPGMAGRMRAGSRSGAMSRSMPGMGVGVSTGSAAELETTFKVRRFDFLVQFIWKPTTPSERREKHEAAPGGEAAPGQPLPSGQNPPPAAPGAT